MKSCHATAPCSRGRLPDARTAACPVTPDHKAIQARTDDQANRVYPARPDFPASHRKRSATISHPLLAKLAHPEHPELQAHLDQQEDPAPTATQALPAKTEDPAQQAHLAQQAAQAQPVAQERRDQPAHQQPAPQPPPAMQAQPEKTDQPDQPAPTAPQETMVDPAQPDPRDHPAKLVTQAPMPAPETKDHQAPTETEASPVSAPSTAPPMAAFSSKMAHDDKRDHNAPHFPRFFNFGTFKDNGSRPRFLVECLFTVLVVLVHRDTAK